MDKNINGDNNQNDYIISTMLEEAQGYKPGVTRKGIVVDLLLNEEDKLNSILVIKVNRIDNYVYMFIKDAPEEFRNKTKLQLINKTISYKPIDYSDGKIIVSNSAIKEHYENLIKTKRVIYGRVIKRETYKNNNNEHKKYKHDRKQYILIVSKGDLIYIPYKEIPDKFRKKKQVVDLLVGVIVTKITDDGKITASINQVYETHKKQMIEHLNNNESVTVKIGKFIPGGALCYYKNDVDCIILNKNFSTDYTNIEDVYKPSDKIKVKKSEIGKYNEYIYIEPIVKYTSPDNIDFKKINIGDKINGKIVRISSFGCFVRIGPGVDVLCPISFKKRDPLVNDNVEIEIVNKKEKERRLRGKINSWNDELVDLTEYGFILKEVI